MKIRKEEIQKVIDEPIELFYQGIRAPVTKEKYTRTLKGILCDIFEDVLEGTFEERASQLVHKGKSDPEWITSLLLALSKKLKERTELPTTDREYLSPNSFPRYFKPIRKLLDMNDVPVAWKRISYTFPERHNTDSESRGYTRQEIQKMLEFTRGPIDTALILVAASSGIREGGFVLNWEDMVPVYKVDDKIVFDITESEESRAQIVCAVLTVYRKTPEEYPAFITPEAYKALMLTLEKYEVVKDMFHGFNYKKFFDLKSSERISFVPSAMEHILKEKGKKERFAREVTALLKAFSLAVPNDKAMKIKEDVGFFQAVKSAISKTTGTGKDDEEKFDTAIKQILSKAVISDRIIDIFEAAGIQKPELSILSEGFLAEVKEMPQKNLAFEALKKLLNDEIKFISKRNIVKGKSFMDMLDKTIKKYTNKSVEAAQVIEELLELARKVRDEKGRGKQQNMNEDEIAFYDALEVNDSAVKVLGDETLRKIALELTLMIRTSVTIDWTQRESVQAEIRLKVKKILRKYGYPPDKQEKATQTVLKQAEVIAKDWAEK